MAESTRRLARRPGAARPRLFDVSRTSTDTDRYGWLLVLVTVAIVGQMLIDNSGSFVRSSLSHALSGGVLVVAVRAAGLDRRLCRVVDVVVVTFLVANIVLAVIDLNTGARWSADHSVSPEIAWLLTAALVPVVVARRLATHRVVTIQTVMGAVAAYLQIAVAYSFIFHAVDQSQAGAMFGRQVTTTSFMYFSLTTITTTGYGDLTPTGQFARLFAMSEAVIGQIFLVTFVALIVSRFAASGRSTITESTDSRTAGTGDDPRTPGGAS